MNTFLAFLLVSIVSVVYGHGRLWEPVGRASAYKRGFNTPINYDDNQMFCGGFAEQVKAGYKCGVCGDPYNLTLNENGIRQSEIGGKWATGLIVAHYQKGQVVDVEFHITANHKGYVDFRICPYVDDSVEVSRECLDRNVLLFVDASARGTQYPISGGYSQKIKTKIQLPSNMMCDHCLLQWRYHTGNSWGCDAPGDCAIGKGMQEEFYACSDVKISENGGERPAAPPTTTTTPGTTTTVGGVTEVCDSYTAGGEFEGNLNMHNWCVANCAVAPCPRNLCRCA